MTLWNSLVQGNLSRARWTLGIRGKDRWCGRWKPRGNGCRVCGNVGRIRGRERDKSERNRMSFRGRLTSLSTRGFSFLCVPASLFRYFTQLPVSENTKSVGKKKKFRPLPLFAYVTLQNGRPDKASIRRIQMIIDPPCIFLFFSLSIKKFLKSKCAIKRFKRESNNTSRYM